MKKRMLTRRTVALICLSSTAYFAFADPALDKFLNLENQKSYKEAYLQGKPLVAQYGGQTNFDLPFGNAALNANVPGEAAFAYDRVLMSNPNNPDALFGIGSAHLKLKKYQNAQKELKRVIRLSSNPAIRLAAMEKLKVVNRLIKRARTPVIAFIRVNGGYDTDVNAAPGAASILIPPITVMVLRPEQRAVSSGFNEVSGGIALQHNVDKDHTFFANISGTQRINYVPRAVPFDYGIFRADTGFIVKKGLWRFRMPAMFQQLFVGESIFQNTLTEGLEITRTVGINVFTLSLGPQFLDYPRAFPRTGYLGLEGLNWILTPKSFPAQINSSIYFAEGSAINPTNNALYNNYWGARLTVRWNGFVRVKPYMTLAYQNTKYRLPNPTFRINRGDNFYNLVAALEWQMTKHWFMTPSYTYSNNNSNIPLNRYTRNLYQIGLEYRMT